MCYKDEVQRKNAEKLQKKFEEDNVPAFVGDYFSFMNSEAGKLNYWGTIKKFLMWCIERNDIRKKKWYRNSLYIADCKTQNHYI